MRNQTMHALPRLFSLVVGLCLAACPAAPDPEDTAQAAHDAGDGVEESDPDTIGDPGPDGGTANDAGADAGVLDDAGADAGPIDRGDTDSGVVDDAGSDAGVSDDAGTDAGAGELVEDEAGDLDAPLDVALPYSGQFDHVPANDRDCVRFTVSDPGTLVVTGGNAYSEDCGYSDFESSYDTQVWLYADGSAPGSTSLDSDDQGGQGNCPLLETIVGAGSYIVCSAHWLQNDAVFGATLSIEFAAFECGNDLVELGEECDGTDLCSDECLIDDGLIREDETTGNGTASAAGVKTLVLEQRYRGTISSSTDEDWWRLQLPGNLGLGAVRAYLGGPDIGATSCSGAPANLRVEIYGGGDFADPVAESSVAVPCRQATLIDLGGEPLIGYETLWLRVTTTGAPSPYHLFVEYLVADCGDGEVQPSEQCEPEVGDTGSICDPVTCRLIAPANDACADATEVELPLDGSLWTTTGNTFTATGDKNWSGTPACQSTSSASSSVDVHFTFVAGQDGRVAFVLDSIGWDAVLYASEGTCGSPLLCDDEPEELEFDVIAGERYTITVDSWLSGKGPFTLSALYLVPPVNDVCSGALAVDISPSDGVVRLEGSTRAAADDAASSSTLSTCSHSPGGSHPDTFYSLTPSADGTLLIRGDAAFAERLYVLSGCGGTQVACGSASLTLPVTAGETYILVVDAYGAEKGEYAVDIRYDPPPVLAGADLCADATPLSAASGAILGSYSGATHNYDAEVLGDCTNWPSLGPDVVYRIDVPAGQTLHASLDAVAADSVLYVADACPIVGSDACIAGEDNGDPEVVSVTNTSSSAKTYFLVVDEWLTVGGTPSTTASRDFVLEWRVSAD